MKKQKYLVSVVCGILVAGGLAGCGMSAAQSGGAPAAPGISAQESREAGGLPGAREPQEANTILAVAEWDGSGQTESAYEERFQPYEKFGLVYHADKNELEYNGKSVRWFEDYYPILDEGQAGMDFFNENGVVDVYAVRDRSELARRADGSYDPSGTLVGVEAFSEEAFAARDVEALRHSAPVTAVAGDAESAQMTLHTFASADPVFSRLQAAATVGTLDPEAFDRGEQVLLLVPLYRDTGAKNEDALRTAEGWERLEASGIHRGWLLLPFILSFACDTFAFFSGLTLGKHKLAPRVSPKKTVEGSIGGLVGNVLCGLAFAWVMNRWFSGNVPYGAMAVLALFCGAVAQVGDLSFSLIKREFGVKDYGKIFFAHGGVLDRFDSVLFVAPVLAALMHILRLGL